jgi:hypothetical protein
MGKRGTSALRLGSIGYDVDAQLFNVALPGADVFNV